VEIICTGYSYSNTYCQGGSGGNDSDSCVSQSCMPQIQLCSGSADCWSVVEALPTDDPSYGDYDIIQFMDGLCASGNYTCGEELYGLRQCVLDNCVDCSQQHCSAEMEACFNDDGCLAAVQEIPDNIDDSSVLEYASWMCADANATVFCDYLFWNLVYCVDSHCAAYETTDTVDTTDAVVDTTDIDHETTDTDVVDTTEEVDIEDCDPNLYCVCLGGTFTLTISSNLDSCAVFNAFEALAETVFSSNSVKVKYSPRSCDDAEANTLVVIFSWDFVDVDTYESFATQLGNQLNDRYLFTPIKNYDTDTFGVEIAFSYESNGFAFYSSGCAFSDGYLNVNDYFADASAGAMWQSMVAMVVGALAVLAL